LLATGRSFRTHLPRNYIQHEQNHALIFAQAGQDKIGIQKMTSGEQVIKVNGDSIATQGQLAKLLPLQLIEPQSTDIIDHGAKPRRQLLDWLMFHVEPDFYTTWQAYTRALKQRNSLLKAQRQLSLLDLEPWNRLLGEYGEILHHQRASIVQRWNTFFSRIFSICCLMLRSVWNTVQGFMKKKVYCNNWFWRTKKTKNDAIPNMGHIGRICV
jgi:DNA replication and repair protein RecF